MSTLKDRMTTIFISELFADVHFVVGKGETQVRFPAHKLVLSIGSAVFDAMFNGPLAHQATDRNPPEVDPQSQKCENDIALPDVEPEAFKSLLTFLYLDEVRIDANSVMATLYVAKKYEVTALESACVNFLKTNLSADNAFMLLTHALLFDEVQLTSMCLETIDKHTKDALYSDTFLEINLETLELVLSRDNLRIHEVTLFKAVVRWAEAECSRRELELTSINKRECLGNALFLVRFPLMNIQEFAINVAQSGLLTDNELVNIFLYFTIASPPHPKPVLPPLVSAQPRCCFTGDECTINRFQRTETRWGYSGTSDRIRFLTDKPIYVIGFGLFGSINGPSEYSVIIEILHTGSNKILASNSTSFASDGSDSVFRVMFKYPVEILPNTSYTACATLKVILKNLLFHIFNNCSL